ncbi:MAG TPA: nuclear transport factor 2 family protein [Gemmatimonadaceae bacterium]|nr:nuclear transport factor 2 family protein [Gemmatimonadaceae bacterium]
MKPFTLLLIVAGLARPLSGQSPDVQRQLVAARDTVWHAWFSNDTALLRRYLPPAAASVEGPASKQWNNRERMIEGARAFATSKARLMDLRFVNTQFAFAGHSALVRSDFQLVMETGSHRDTTSGHATELFVLVDGTWVNPYWQLEPSSNLNDAGRAIPMPDTLGANFAIADSASRAGTLTDYDALIGSWEFRYQNRRPDGSFSPAFTGHWTFEKKPGGGLIEDRWRPDNPAIPMAISLYTYRVFAPERKVWQMIGASSNGGAVQPGLTWSDGKDRYAIQRGDGTLSRIHYLSIDPNHFLWRSDRSTDGGRTWLLDSGTMEATRIGK